MGIGAVLLAAAAAANPFSLGVAPKDAAGRIVNDITGQPCTPIVVQAR
jgi:hypothetical protein